LSTLSSSSSLLAFLQIRLDVSKREEGKIRARNLYNNAQLKTTPLTIVPASNIAYFEEEKSLGLVQMIMNNKMLWMIGGMFGNQFCL